MIGKVTQVWPSEEDVVLLYRRSVLSLLPALSGQLMAGVFAFLIGMAKAIGVVDVEQQVRDAIGAEPSTEQGADEGGPDTEEGDGPVETDTDPDQDESDDLDDVLVGHDIEALHPVLTGPAVQVLPLGLCA